MTESYRVLARQYRPQTFADMIGQEVLVTTLSNAFKSGRIAQAYMLTGVRGVGKTTTARILAKALNCVGVDGNGGATVSPCGVCPQCVAINDDRHVDVIELDAATHTGVDQMRVLLEGMHYRPVLGRRKVYILDEVHMLSESAFNALLKNLEEPPPHVTFIFATTEIRQVPLTVLSRCQRFDLRRISAEALADYFIHIAGREGIKLDADAAALLARAADGSARDGLSLLDQAIVNGDGVVTAAGVRAMLGLADRHALYELLAALLQGDATTALQAADSLYQRGIDVHQLLQDLAAVVHFISKAKLMPAVTADITLGEMERQAASQLAQTTSFAVLSRAWQILQRGCAEVYTSDTPQAACDMVLLRLAYIKNWPLPEELIQQWQKAGGAATVAPPAVTAAPAAVTLNSFDELVRLFETNKEITLKRHLQEDVRVQRYQDGIIEWALSPKLPANFGIKIQTLLQQWTGRAWQLIPVATITTPTLGETQRAQSEAKRNAALQDPLVQEALSIFPDANVASIEIKGA